MTVIKQWFLLITYIEGVIEYNLFQKYILFWNSTEKFIWELQ